MKLNEILLEDNAPPELVMHVLTNVYKSFSQPTKGIQYGPRKDQEYNGPAYTPLQIYWEKGWDITLTPDTDSALTLYGEYKGHQYGAYTIDYLFDLIDNEVVEISGLPRYIKWLLTDSNTIIKNPKSYEGLVKYYFKDNTILMNKWLRYADNIRAL